MDASWTLAGAINEDAMNRSRRLRRWRWVTRDQNPRDEDHLVDDTIVSVWPGISKPRNTQYGVNRKFIDFYPNTHQGHSVDWPVNEFAKVFGERIANGTCQKMVFAANEIP